MRKLLLLFILFQTQNALGQQDTIVKYFNFNGEETTTDRASFYCVAFKHDTVWRRLDFFAANDRLKRNSYFIDDKLNYQIGVEMQYDENGKLLSKGHFINNKKEGIWMQWYPDGKLSDSVLYQSGLIINQRSYHPNGQIERIIETSENAKATSMAFFENGVKRDKGELINGKKEGLWDFYDNAGAKIMEVNFLFDSAITITCTDKNILKKECIYEREAEFKGGQKSWLKHLESAMSKYLPKEYFNGNMEGFVVVQFIINTDGKVIEPKIRFSSEPKLNEAAIKIISSSSKWVPAVQYNRNVKAYRLQPLTFTKAVEE